MLKTFLIDGDKGGVGKTLTARSLLSYFYAVREDVRIAAIDADQSNPDVCGKGGVERDHRVCLSELVALGEKDGWLDLAQTMDPLLGFKDDVRCVINLPAQIGMRAFISGESLADEYAEPYNMIPVWVIGPRPESIAALDYRVKNFPTLFRRGAVVRNQHLGNPDDFAAWDASPLRQRLLATGWVDVALPAMSPRLVEILGRKLPIAGMASSTEPGEVGPFANSPWNGWLPWGYRLALTAWLRKSDASMSQIEALGDA